MRPFEYASPRSRQDVVTLLAEKPGQAVVLAGGTDLLSLMKNDVETPTRVVDIKSVADLRGIDEVEGGLRIGPLVTLRELIGHSGVREAYPSLVQAARGVRSAQLRSMGTVGGELCQRPRCWYYRTGFGLLARRDGTPLVPGGENRYHAILGNAGPAYFVSPSSLAPALVALGAKVRLLGSGGERERRLDEFFRIPTAEGQREHDLAADEIVTDILVPPSRGKNATYEVREKEALDWPLAAAAVALEMSGGRIESAEVVLGHVAPVPWRAPAASKALEGKAPNEAAAEAAGRAAVEGAKALSGNQYKIRLAQVAVKRAALRAAGQEV
jgi:xanthine dehydrogenase YagS FAD-binding subunit